MKLARKTVAVGVTGGIAAYKACEVVSSLKKEGADVYVAMTKNATEFVSPMTFETLSGHRVSVATFDRNFEYDVKHISLAKRADLFLIAPATANFVGKFACGIADDFLTTTVMAAKCPVVVAPAMNTGMLTSAAYVQNEETLKKRGVIFVESGIGRLACGDTGAGRLAEPKTIVEKVIGVLNPKSDYAGKTLLITSGGTKEPIDPVRFITNRSSGKMGAALADAAVRRGGKVVYICGENAAEPKCAAEVIKVRTTEEMLDACLKNYERCDFIIKAAAPSDYKVAKVAGDKIKSEKLTLELVKNPDIAKTLGEKKGGRKLIVFAAETSDAEKNAAKKLISKNADMVVLNDVSKEGAGFDVDTNIATLITKESKTELDIMSKADLADVILDAAVRL